MSLIERTATAVSAAEADQIARSVRTWLNTYTSKPATVDFEYLTETKGLALTTVQAAYKTAEYIDGSYQAQYQFALVYRTIPTSTEERMQADEALNAFGAWAESMTALTLGTGLHPIKVIRNQPSALAYRYENGAEDHQIIMTLLYEVI